MKPKKLASLIAAGVAAITGGIVSSPSGQQLMEQAANANRNVQTIEQKAPTQRFVNNQQQAQNRLPGQTVQQYLSNPYAPLGGARYGNPYGMSPKEYGEYLMRTGKDKQNKRKRQKIARGIA